MNTINKAILLSAVAGFAFLPGLASANAVSCPAPVAMEQQSSIQNASLAYYYHPYRYRRCFYRCFSRPFCHRYYYRGGWYGGCRYHHYRRVCRYICTHGHYYRRYY